MVFNINFILDQKLWENKDMCSYILMFLERIRKLRDLLHVKSGLLVCP